MKFGYRIACLASSSVGALFAVQTALATDFNVPGGDLRAALDSYKSQSGISLFVLTDWSKECTRRASKANCRPTRRFREFCAALASSYIATHLE